MEIDYRCPFCGEEEKLTIDSELFGTKRMVVCKCGASGPHEDTAEEAIVAWNRRA